jgi:hypothetical protein
MACYRVKILAMTMALSRSFLGLTLMAQQPTAAGSGGLGVLGANLLALVTNPVVQEHLKLTEEQKAQLKALAEWENEQRLQWLERMGVQRPDGVESREDSRSREGQPAQIGPGGRPASHSNRTGRRHVPDNPDEPEQQPSFETMLETRLRLQQSTERSIARILSQSQYARVRQIQLQAEGPGALLRPDIQKRLLLDEEQTAQIRALMLERRRALRETRNARGTLKQAALDRKMIEKRFNAALHSEVLTRRQSQAYGKMLGAPF